MSVKTVAGLLVAAGAGVVAGVAYVWGEATYHAELKAKNRYDELTATMERVYEFRLQRALPNQNIFVNVDDGPVETESDLDAPDVSDDAIKVGGEMIVETPIADPAYVEVSHSYAGDVITPDGTEVPWSISIIEEEDYHDEDGRAKERISIFMEGDNPIFLMDGDTIENWAELVGDDILKEFYKRIGPGQERVLYVRNHRRDEDYEVIQEIP